MFNLEKPQLLIDASKFAVVVTKDGIRNIAEQEDLNEKTGPDAPKDIRFIKANYKCTAFYTVTKRGFYVIGKNAFGQLGIGPKKNAAIKSRQKVKLVVINNKATGLNHENIRSIAVGERHLLVLTNSELFVCGECYIGGLGSSNAGLLHNAFYRSYQISNRNKTYLRNITKVKRNGKLQNLVASSIRQVATCGILTGILTNNGLYLCDHTSPNGDANILTYIEAFGNAHDIREIKFVEQHESEMGTLENVKVMVLKNKELEVYRGVILKQLMTASGSVVQSRQEKARYLADKEYHLAVKRNRSKETVRANPWRAVQFFDTKRDLYEARYVFPNRIRAFTACGRGFLILTTVSLYAGGASDHYTLGLGCFIREERRQRRGKLKKLKLTFPASDIYEIAMGSSFSLILTRRHGLYGCGSCKALGVNKSGHIKTFQKILPPEKFSGLIPRNDEDRFKTKLHSSINNRFCDAAIVCRS